MILGLISDIHGNFPALKSVLQQLEKKECDEIVCLGDVCGYYSMVNECIELLREYNIVTLIGNHDNYLLGNGRCNRSRTVNECIKFQKSIIKEENLNWLKQNKLEYKTDIYAAVHGGWNDPLDEYVKHFDFSIANEYDVNYFFTGHTHVPIIEKYNNYTYCNPGAVGQPRDYDCRAAFAIIDDGIVYLKRIKYDIDLIAKHMSESGFNDYFYRNLYHGCKIGDI